MKSTEPDSGPDGPEILYEDNHLLALNKPAGMPSQPDASGDRALDEYAREYIRVKYAKPGQVYLALLHRLDRPTSGAILLARTEKAAGRMANLFRERAVEKIYTAVLRRGKDASDLAVEGAARNFLVPGTKGGMRISDGKIPGAREARLAWKVRGVSPDGRLVLAEVNLPTGVKHQIRCQFAALGWPVEGDFRYGPGGGPARPKPIAEGRAILLHAHRVGFEHPVRKEPIEIAAPLPPHWRGTLKNFSPDATNGPA